MLTIPITSKISIESRARQKRVMNIKDTRIKVENEVLGGMKIIKLYAWERPFMSKITATRDRELHALWKYQLLQVCETQPFVIFFDTSLPSSYQPFFISIAISLISPGF